jgi:AcrR family transcriptional regulator
MSTQTMTACISLKAVDGRVLKKKGVSTRQRILEVLEALLQDTPASDVRVAHIAAAADVAMPTFYSYFESLEDALLALVEQDKFAYAAVLNHLQDSWPDAEALDRARAFVTAYYDFWDEHRAVLRLRNIRGDEGDARFVAVRLAFTLPILDALSEKLALAKAMGRLPARVPANAFAGVIIAALERNGSAYIHVTRHNRVDLVEASAQTLAMWLLGAPPPPSANEAAA